MNCPLCGGPSRRRFEAHGHWIRDCEPCGHRFAELIVTDDHVARVYGDGYFRDGGAGYADYLSEGPILRERGRYYGALLAGHLRPGKVLDVGCAAGFTLQGLINRGFRGQGLEPNAAMAEHARKQLALDVRTGTLEQLNTPERYELIVMIQVIAHFGDVRGALTTAAAHLAPGGHLLVESWDRSSWAARLLGRHWHEYSPPSVLHWFSKESLGRLAQECGFDEVARGRPKRRIRADHAKALLRHKYAGSPLGSLVTQAARLIPDGATLPYPADDLFWMLLRLTRAAAPSPAGS